MGETAMGGNAVGRKSRRGWGLAIQLRMSAPDLSRFLSAAHRRRLCPIQSHPVDRNFQAGPLSSISGTNPAT